jgi:hypothetical protein
MNTRRLRSSLLLGLVSALALSLALFARPSWSQDCLAAQTTVNSIDMKLLVISADGNEPVFSAITSTLEHIGIPYDAMIAKDELLTAARLCSITGTSGRGRYQGILLTTGNLAFFNTDSGNWESAFTTEEWSRLWQYEAKYRVRQVTLYTFPAGLPENYGLDLRGAIDTTAGLPAALTTTSPAGSGNPTGRQVFSYLNVNNPIFIQHAWTYLATPTATVTPLLVTSSGDSIVSINNYPDGRKNMTITADGNVNLLHTLQLGYGVVNWVTKGLYIGQRKVYLTAQPDDIMIADDMWDPATLSDTTGKLYRMTGSDFRQAITWQSRLNSSTPNAAGIKLEFPFNGFGTDPEYPPDELFPATTDDLTPAIRAEEEAFNWVSHTFTHLNLNAATYAETLAELRANNRVATNVIAMTFYHKDSLVTPEISGLNNAEALRAMRDFGIRYLVSDTSKFCGHRDAAHANPCPTPNTGIYNDLRPEILMIPRYPTNLFYNVCTPTEWVSEYNHIYRTFWGRDLSYEEILGNESDVWVRYMIRYDMRPLMFHQPNTCAYGGGRSLLGDLIEMTMAKYNAMFNLPVLSRRQRQIASLMIERMNLNGAVKPATGAPLTGRIVPNAVAGRPASIVVNNPTSRSVVVPITGVNWTNATSRETYGGQTTSRVTIGANGATVTVPNAPAW